MVENFYGFENFFNNNDKIQLNNIVNYIDNKYSNKRKIKYDTASRSTYNMSHIYYVLKTGIQWKALMCQCNKLTVRKKIHILEQN